MTGNSIRGTLTPQVVINGVDTHFQEGFLEDMPYDIPNYLADYAMRNTHVPVGFWRSVNHSQNAFFKESFIDELAHVAGIDPYLYRRKLLGKHRHADKYLARARCGGEAGRLGTPPPPGIHRGIALNEANGTFMRGCRRGVGERRRPRAGAPHDRGDRSRPRGQSADRRACRPKAAVVFGLTAALYGEITIKDGRVEQSNFHDYQMLRHGRDAEGRDAASMPTRRISGAACGEPPVAIGRAGACAMRYSRRPASASARCR